MMNTIIKVSLLFLIRLIIKNYRIILTIHISISDVLIRLKVYYWQEVIQIE